MEPPESEVAKTPARRASRLRIPRSVGLVLLVLCMVAVGARSGVLSSRLSRPAAVHGIAGAAAAGRRAAHRRPGDAGQSLAPVALGLRQRHAGLRDAGYDG